MKTICVVTGTRAEYGLLRWVMDEISAAPDLQLQLVVTGTHLSPEFGLTFSEIESDGFAIDCKVEMLLSSDTAVGVSKSMGLALSGLADAFDQLQPDLVLLLGDRYEIFAAASAAMVARIPIAHLHGGETSEGAIDEAIRHAITKMAHLHFVAAEDYWQRVVQLGEHPDRVFVVGGLGVDSILRLELMGRSALEESLGFRFKKRNFMVTFHPATLEPNEATQQLSELLAALDDLPETGLIFTMPNADSEGRALKKMIEEFTAGRPNAVAFESLGQLRYLSCLQQVDGVLGNSSSGLTEAPSFKKGTINVGNRQRGRLKADSVIDCSPKRNEIRAAIETLLSREFQNLIEGTSNPYGDGGASAKIVKELRQRSFEGLLLKSFHTFAKDEARR